MNAIPKGDSINPIEQELLAGLKEKEPRAIYMAFQLFNTQLYYFTYNITHHQQESEDIVHECFVSLWNNASDFPTIAKLKNCLYVYARNKAFNYVKRSTIRKRKEPDVIG